MSTTQDNKMTTADAESTSTSQDACDKPSSCSQDHRSTSSISQTMRNSDDPIGNPDLGPPGHNLNPNRQPGENPHLDMPLSVNHQKRLDNAFKLTFESMIEDFEKGHDKAAEALATELLLWGNLPILYRTYAHIVLAYGPVNGLYHVCLAVQDAEWGIRNFADKEVGQKLLAVAEMTLKDVMGDDEVDDTEEATGEDEENA